MISLDSRLRENRVRSWSNLPRLCINIHYIPESTHNHPVISNYVHYYPIISPFQDSWMGDANILSIEISHNIPFISHSYPIISHSYPIHIPYILANGRAKSKTCDLQIKGIHHDSQPPAKGFPSENGLWSSTIPQHIYMYIYVFIYIHKKGRKIPELITNQQEFSSHCSSELDVRKAALRFPLSQHLIRLFLGAKHRLHACRLAQTMQTWFRQGDQQSTANDDI